MAKLKPEAARIINENRTKEPNDAETFRGWLDINLLGDASSSFYGLKQACSKVTLPAYNPPLSDGVALSTTYRLGIIFPQYTYGIKFVFGNFFTQGAGGEGGIGLGTINITAALEYNGEFRSITFNGALSFPLSVLRRVVSDECTIDIPAGATAYIRVCPTVASGSKWPLVAQAGALDSWSAINTDLTLTTGALPNVGPLGVYAPFAVLGRTYPKRTGSVLFIGDSIGAGAGDILLLKEGGFLVRAFGNNSPWANYCMPGQTMAQILQESVTNNRSALYGSFDYCISEIGSNSLGTDTLATLQTSYQKLWKKFQARGIPIWQTTIIPRTTSTDYWRTATNQDFSVLGGSTITNATNTSPIVVTTSAPNGLTTGQTLKISGVGGNTATNGNNWIVTVIDSTSFSLNGSTGNGSYTSGGTAFVCESTRVALNNWLRTVPAPLAGIIDVCENIEVNALNVLTQNGGRWITNTTVTSGTATGGSTFQLQDTSKTWNAGVYTGYTVLITGGTGAGQTRQIINNTATALSISPAWSTNPDNTSVYVVYAAPTIDGVHPSAYAHQIMAQSVPISQFPKT